MDFNEIKREFRKLVKSSSIAGEGYLQDMESYIQELWDEIDEDEEE